VRSAPICMSLPTKTYHLGEYSGVSPKFNKLTDMAHTELLTGFCVIAQSTIGSFSLRDNVHRYPCGVTKCIPLE